MANKFVSAYASGAFNGSDEAHPWTLTQALASAAVGDYVWIKDDRAYTTGCPWTLWVGGSYANNTHIYFIGYHNSANCDFVNHISDMDYGQPYWGGPLNPSAVNCWVDINGSDTANSVLWFDSRDNVHFRNLYFHNTNRASGNYAVYVENSKGVTFTKCKFADSYINLYFETCYSCLVEYCYFNDFASENFNPYTASGANHIISNCVFNGGTITIYRSSVYGSLFIGGVYGLRTYNYNNAFNNVFYGQTSYGISYGHNTFQGGLIEHNNIFVPATKAVLGIYKAGDGSLTYSGYGCAYCLAAPAGVLDVPYAGENALNVDPQFMNPAGNDFRPRNPLVLRGGKPDFAGNPAQIGAILQKYQFANRSRAANPGRLSIFK